LRQPCVEAGTWPPRDTSICQSSTPPLLLSGVARPLRTSRPPTCQSVLAILTYTETIQLWHIYVLAAVLGAVSAFEMPIRQVFLSELVERDELQSAVSLNSSMFNGARIIGPGIGGVIIAIWGVAACFALNAFSFLAVQVSLAILDASTMHGVRRPVWDQLGDGIRYAKRTPVLAFTLVLLSVIGTFGYNFGVSLPLLATQALQLGAVGFGSLNTAMGVGSLFGALGLAARLDPTRRSLLLSAASFSAALLIVAFLPWYPMTLVALVVLGIFSVTYSAATNTILQLNSDEEYRGRVLSLYTLLFAGSTPIGGAITGASRMRWGFAMRSWPRRWCVCLPSQRACCGARAGGLRAHLRSPPAEVGLTMGFWRWSAATSSSRATRPRSACLSSTADRVRPT
jgi:MFS family permease